MTALSGRSGHGQLYLDGGSSPSGLGRRVLICGDAIVGDFGGLGTLNSPFPYAQFFLGRGAEEFGL